MNKNYQLGGFLILISTALGIVGASWLLNQPQHGEAIGIVGLAGLGSAFGWVLIIKQYSKNKVWPTELADDVEALKDKRLTRTLVFGLGLLVLTALFVYAFVYYQKLDARWAGFPVIGIAIAAAAITGLIVHRTNWFQYRDWRLSNKMLLIPLLGLVLSVSSGIYFTEPLEYGGMSRNDIANPPAEATAQANDYSRSRSGSFIYYYWYGSSGSTSSSSASSSSPKVTSGPVCSGKGCEGLGIVILVILVVVIVLCSVFIAHFWVVGGLVLLTILWMQWWRELMVADDSVRRKSRWSYY